jgi:hypothetical protein
MTVKRNQSTFGFRAVLVLPCQPEIELHYEVGQQEQHQPNKQTIKL